ncbi:MAG: choice-of-anchor D domain-containing protein [Candidatus Kapabacteria bacterium]|nr:choice-of-anchor D domain-containing protein [Candidatus Kapabacteria bacterium]
MLINPKYFLDVEKNLSRLFAQVLRLFCFLFTFFILFAFASFNIKAQVLFNNNFNNIFEYQNTSFQYNIDEHFDTLAPVPAWSFLCNGLTVSGIVKDMPDNDSIRSNLARIDFLTDSSYNYNFSFKAFISGQTRSTTWSLSVQDPAADARAFIRFSDRRGNDTLITIQYFSQKITINQTNYDFGNINTGEKKKRDFVITNTNASEQVRITDLFFSKDSSGFTIDSIMPKLPIILPSKASFTFTVSFNSNTNGMFENKIIIWDSTCYKYGELNLTATVGLPKIMVGSYLNKIWDMDFQSQEIYSKNSQKISIRNIGEFDLIISGYKNFSNPVFISNMGRIISLNNPLIIKSGDPDFYFEVLYTPNHLGTNIDSIIFYSNGRGADSICRVIGTSYGIDNVTEPEDSINDNEYLEISPIPCFTDDFVIKYKIQENCLVKLTISNTLDEIITIPLNEAVMAGVHSISYHIGSLQNGIYLCKIQAGRFRKTIKFVISR